MYQKLINNLQIGTKLNNHELCEIFLCSPQGGMRRSLKTNALVLVSNHIKSIYDDRWENDILHYTGMGTIGDQRFDQSQNKTLYESETNQVNIYLFEVFKDKEYTYTGKMELADEPYKEQQPDSAGNLRNVCVFPLKLTHGSRLLLKDDIDAATRIKLRRLSKLSDEEVLAEAHLAADTLELYQELATNYKRNVYVAEYAKRRAKGMCQLCDQAAPFNTPRGAPYLESHHIIWLAQGGKDTIENTVALCPNCHKKMHIVNSETDKAKLRGRASFIS